MQANKRISKRLFFRELPANGAIFSKSTPFVPRFKNIRDMLSGRSLGRCSFHNQNGFRIWLFGSCNSRRRSRRGRESEREKPVKRRGIDFLEAGRGISAEDTSSRSALSRRAYATSTPPNTDHLQIHAPLRPLPAKPPQKKPLRRNCSTRAYELD